MRESRVQRSCGFVRVFVPLRHRRARPRRALIDRLETAPHRDALLLFRICPPPQAADKCGKGAVDFGEVSVSSCKSSLDGDKPTSWRNKTGVTPIRQMCAILSSPGPGWVATPPDVTSLSRRRPKRLTPIFSGNRAGVWQFPIKSLDMPKSPADTKKDGVGQFDDTRRHEIRGSASRALRFVIGMAAI